MADKEHTKDTREDGEDAKKIRKEYEKIRKKYDLPSFNELDSEFELRKLDIDGFIIRELRRAIIHKIQNFADWLSPILNPHPDSLHSAIETKIFEKQEISDMLKFYKKLGYFIHISLVASLKSEEEEVKFIKNVLNEWPGIKGTITNYVERISEGWAKKEEDTDHRSEYSS